MSYQSNCNRDDRPQEISHHRQRAATLESQREEFERVEAPPTTLTIGVNALRDLVPIVVVLGQSARTAIPSIARTILL